MNVSIQLDSNAVDIPIYTPGTGVTSSGVDNNNQIFTKGALQYQVHTLKVGLVLLILCNLLTRPIAYSHWGYPVLCTFSLGTSYFTTDLVSKASWHSLQCISSSHSPHCLNFRGIDPILITY